MNAFLIFLPNIDIEKQPIEVGEIMFHLRRTTLQIEDTITSVKILHVNVEPRRKDHMHTFGMGFAVKRD